MRPLKFHYSLSYDDLMTSATGTFSDWIESELSQGGASDQRGDYKVVELTAHYVPFSPRQLLELAMQCEALLDVAIDDPIFGYQAEDAYEALRIAVSRRVAQELQMQLEARKVKIDASNEVTALRSDGARDNGRP
jgi:hypothetical protein